MSDTDPYTDTFKSIRVVPKPQARKLCGDLSDRTWERMEARGETPPKTQLSPGRIGYRVSDIKKWLDARKVGATAVALLIAVHGWFFGGVS